MSFIKTALLASAAGLMAAGGAFAADLPSRKAAPVEYVKVCDIYGARFFYIPGTDTCLRVRGRVRFQMSMIGTGNVWVPQAHTVNGAGATTPGTMRMTNSNGRDTLGWYARGYSYFDARTPTAWGTLQTFFSLRVNSTSGHLSNGYGTYVSGNAFTPTLNTAYIRFAGFTFGRAAHILDFFPSGVYGSKFASSGHSSGVEQIAYTAVFGGGFTATVGLVNMRSLNNDRVGQLGGITGGLFQRGGVEAVRGPSRLPALVGALQLKQGWGEFHLGGAVQQFTANLTDPNPFQVVNNNGPLVTRTGWAAQTAVKINLPMLAKGDFLFIEAGYARGALGHILEDYTSGPGGGRTLMPGLQRRDDSIYVYGVGGTAAAPALAVASELTTAWKIGAHLRHYWTPSLRSHIHVSYANITPGTQTRNTDWTEGGLSSVKGLAATANLIWSPVSGFDIGAEVGYVSLRQRLTGDNGGIPTPIPVAIANGFKTNTNGWEFRLRVQRDY